MADSADLAESITFIDFGYDTGSGRQSLEVAAALANTNRPPVLQVVGIRTGMLRVGTRLTLHWEKQDGLLIRAGLSLTCRDIVVASCCAPPAARSSH